MAPSAASAASGLRRALQGTCVMHDGLDIRGYDWEIHNIQRMKRKRLDMDVEVGRAEEGDFEAHCLSCAQCQWHTVTLSGRRGRQSHYDTSATCVVARCEWLQPGTSAHSLGIVGCNYRKQL